MMNLLFQISFLIMYPIFIYGILKHFKAMDAWKNSQKIVVPAQFRLIKLTKMVVNFFFVFYSIILILWLPVILIMAIAQSSISTWGVDISVFAKFTIDSNLLENITFTGLRHPEFSGKGPLSIDTSSLIAWYLFAITQFISAAIALYATIQLRSIIDSVALRAPFIKANAHRVKKIGLLFMFWSLITPFIQYFAWGYVVKTISFSTPGIELNPAFELNAGALTIGVMLVILSQVLKEASLLQAEQELTI